TPDRLSTAVRVTVTGAAYQPLANGSGTLTRVLGAVRSMLTAGLLDALVVLPALSLTDALALRPLPSPSIVLLGGQAPGLAMPERASLQLKLTVTSVLFQPVALATSERSAVMVGAVLSMLTVAGS